MVVHKSQARKAMKPDEAFYIGPDFLLCINTTKTAQRQKHIFGPDLSLSLTLEPDKFKYYEPPQTNTYQGSVVK